MIDALMIGTIHGQATKRTSANGSDYAVCKLRAAAGETSYLVNVIAFSQTAMNGLLALGVGDSVAVVGNITPKIWTPDGGAPRITLDMTAHGILSTYQVQRRRAAVQGEAPTRPDRPTKASHAPTGKPVNKGLASVGHLADLPDDIPGDYEQPF